MNRRRTIPAPDARKGRGLDAALQLVGLAQRAGQLVLGTAAVKEAARRGELAAVVMAADATGNARARVLPLLQAVEVPVAWCPRADLLGRSVGRSRIVIVGLSDGGLAGKVLEALGETAV